ncbi:MAG: TIGR00725 family protein [Candidatus Aminicenantia bacterium]
MIDFQKKIRIGVIGGGKKINQKIWNLAYQVGKLIAQKGAILVCGGLWGVMEAAAKGAKEAGGYTIGILPGNDIKEANPFIGLPIATGLGYSRNSLVAMNSEVIIAVDGQYGTLTEIAYGLIYGKKVIGLQTWEIEGIIKANTPEEAIKLAFK